MTPEAATADHDDQLGAIIAAWLEAVEAGLAPDDEQWLHRHAEFAPELREFFASQEELQSLAGPLFAVARAATTRLPGWTPLPEGQGSSFLGGLAVRSFGDYEVGAEIGRGGMGIVYRARQLSLNRPLALKVLRTDQEDVAAMLRRFRHEAELIALLDHPAVIPIYEVGEQDGWVYYTMKLIEGSSLAATVADGQGAALGREAQRRAAGLVAALARAVHHAHERGVLHRDLKPSNILLDREGRPYVTDFGLGRLLHGDSELTQSGVLVGTPSYMAPEQTSSRRGVVTVAADVYGLGGILYALLTGRPPFRGDTILDTLTQVRECAPEPPSRSNPRVARDLETICLKCLEKEPARRYATAQALADDLERFLRGEQVLARPTPGWERAWKWARRQPAAAALVVVSMLSLLGLIAGVLVHNGQLQQAVDQAEANEAQALRQQELARSHYRRARDTLERVLQQFESYGLGEVPQLKELQRKQLEKALAFYEGALAEQDDPDPAVRADTAVACKNAADIQNLLGRPAAAAANYCRAIELLTDLPPEYRDTADHQLLLASCYNNRGVQAFGPRSWADAERDHRQALAILEALARDRPHDLRGQQGLADTEHLLGALFAVGMKYRAAEPHFQRSIRLLEKLSRAQPTVELYQRRQADNWINLALVYQTTSRPAEATAAYGKSEELLNALLARQPTNGEYTLSLASLCSNWGPLLRDQGQPALALAKYSRAIELATKVLEREPNHGRARFVARNAYGSRAQYFEGLRRWAEAARDWDRVVELDAGPDQWIRRVLRAVVLARAGEHTRAAAEAARLVKDKQVSDEGRYDLACACALSMKAVHADTKLPTAERHALTERYAAQAVVLLRQLQARGYFRDAGHAKTLATDEDLQPLHGRPDFEQLRRAVQEDSKRSK